MNIKIRLRWGLAGIGVVGIFLWFSTGVMVGRTENQTDHSVEFAFWTATTTIEQTFIASQNRLCRIDFFVDSFYPWDTPSLECRLFELDTTEEPSRVPYDVLVARRRQVRSQQINGWVISGHMFNSFRFTPIADSSGKRYLFTIQAPDLRKGGPSILLASTRDRYEEGDLFVDGEKKIVDLSFRTLYVQPRGHLLQRTIARLTLHKPWPFASSLAYYGLLVIYIGSLVALACLL